LGKSSDVKMSLLEDRILRIIELRQQGLDDVVVAQEMGLSVGMIGLYEKQVKNVLSSGWSSGRIGISELALSVVSDYYGVSYGKSSKRIHKPFEERVKEIKESIANGARDYEAIVDDTGLAIGTVRKYVFKGEIQLPKDFIQGNESKNKRLERIKEAVEQGVESMEELHRKIPNLKPYTIAIYCRDNNIEVPFDLKIYYQENNPVKDALIREGRFTLRELGEQPEFHGRNGGVSYECVRQYIVGTDQVKVYHEAKERFRRRELNKEQERKSLLGNLIRGVCDYKAEQELDDLEVFAYEMAMGREEGFQKSSLRNFWKEMEVYKRHIQAVMDGEEVPLEKLGEGLRLFSSNVSRLLKLVGEEPTTGARVRRSPLNSGEVELVERGFETDLTGVELEYFTGIKSYIFNQRCSKKLKGSETTRREVKKEFKMFGHKPLNRARLSEIYLASDMGYSNEDMCEMFNVSMELVKYASEHRDEHEPEIINRLKKLYPDKSDDITKPYLDWK